MNTSDVTAVEAVRLEVAWPFWFGRVVEVDDLKMGDVVEGEKILALLDLEGTPAAPDVLVAVGTHVLRLDDFCRLMRRRGPRRSSLLLVSVSRLFMDERLREAFWPTWLDVQNIDKFDEGERW